ncbi:MAG: galactose mutarotase [bacterium]|nr:galactose mutarotase [bacterium]
MSKASFGKTTDGREVTKYTLKNAAGMEVDLIDLGASIVAVRVADKNGDVKDVVLGYDTPADYQNVRGYLGAVIGRNGNRIDKAKFSIDGVEYQLEVNDNENNLHSGKDGFHAMIWNVAEADDSHVKMTLVSPDGHQGFPGNMDVSITYTLTEDCGLELSYRATTDKTTVANFTNHAYFNLDGHESGSAEDQELELLASYYTPVIDSQAIPTGEIASVSDTPMDFRKMTRIGDRINDDFEQLVFVGGYDHNYVLDKADGTMQLAARARSVKSGIQMDVYTNCVGIQFYAGNFVGGQTGKGGVEYGKRQGFCLETQYFPNSVNEKNFEQPFLKPGEVYESTTKYVFSVAQ